MRRPNAGGIRPKDRRRKSPAAAEMSGCPHSLWNSPAVGLTAREGHSFVGGACGIVRAVVCKHRGLDWFTLFLADIQTGFGPFVAIYLTAHAWPQFDIGLVLTAGGLVALACQMPGGALVDARAFGAISCRTRRGSDLR